MTSGISRHRSSVGARVRDSKPDEIADGDLVVRSDGHVCVVVHEGSDRPVRWSGGVFAWTRVPAQRPRKTAVVGNIPPGDVKQGQFRFWA